MPHYIATVSGTISLPAAVFTHRPCILPPTLGLLSEGPNTTGFTHDHGDAHTLHRGRTTASAEVRDPPDARTIVPTEASGRLLLTIGRGGPRQLDHLMNAKVYLMRVLTWALPDRRMAFVTRWESE